MWMLVLWHSKFHCLGIVLFGTQKYDVEAYTGIILNPMAYILHSGFRSIGHYLPIVGFEPIG